MTSSQSDSSMLKDILSRRIPALLTRMSRPPKVSTAWSTTFLPPSHELMSSPLTAASPPRSLMRATTSSAGCSAADVLVRAPPTSLTMTRAPSLDKRSASSRPMPLPAPVTMATLPSSRPMVLPLSRMFSYRWFFSNGGRRPRCRAARAALPMIRSGAKPVQRGRCDLLDQCRRLRPGPGAPEPLGEADDLHPRWWRAQERRVGPAADTEHRTSPAHPRQHATGHLAAERGGVEVPLPGDDHVGPGQPGVKIDQPRHQVESVNQAGAQGDQPSGQPSGRPRAGRGVDVDPEVAPVAVGEGTEAVRQPGDLRGRGALLGAEDPGGLAEWRRHVTGHGD